MRLVILFYFASLHNRTELKTQIHSITYVDDRGVFHFKKDPASLTVEQIREFTQIRESKAYKGQPHMPGFFYMTRTSGLVTYESRLEMLVLMQLDYNPSTAAVISQIVRIFSVSASSCRTRSLFGLLRQA